MCLSLLPFLLISISYLWLISSTEHKVNYPLNTDDLQISFSAQDLSFKILAEYHCSTNFSLAAILLTLFVSSALHQTLTLSVPWRLIMGYIFPIFLSVSAVSVSSHFQLVPGIILQHSFIIGYTYCNLILLGIKNLSIFRTRFKLAHTVSLLPSWAASSLAFQNKCDLFIISYILKKYILYHLRYCVLSNTNSYHHISDSSMTLS